MQLPIEFLSKIKSRVNRLSSHSFVHRWPVFYGWIVMVAGSLGLVMTSPGQTYTVSIFIEHFIEDLSISRSAVSTVYSLGTLAGSLTLPLWGRQIDRYGSRKMVVLIAFLFGLACIYMGFIQNLVMLGIGFIAIDRIPVKYLLSIAWVFQSLSLWRIQSLDSTVSVYTLGILLGVTGGLFQTIGAVVWPAFYGRRHLGSIYGFASAAGVLGAALGPLPFGIVRDVLGSYQLVLYAASAISLVLALSSLSVQKPMKQPVF